LSGQPVYPGTHPPLLVFRYPRNWTAVVFFGLLGLVHWGMAALAVGWGSQMSVIFGGLFVGVAMACLVVRHEVAVMGPRKRLVVRLAVRRHVLFERVVPFTNVIAVRVSLLGIGGAESGVSIVCKREELEMPPTKTPRQEGLLLAMILEVRLVKVYGNGNSPGPAERIARLYRNEGEARRERHEGT
jgi:hypothetical protein